MDTFLFLYIHKFMKKFLLFYLIICLLQACSGPQKPDNKQTSIPTYCDKDTLEVIELTTQYLEFLKNKEFDQALQMIHHVKGDSVFAITEREKQELQKQYKLFPVLSYKIEGYTFTDIYHNEITYSIEFFEKKSDKDIPNTMRFTLQPKRINAVWYLTTLNRSHMQR